MHMRRCMPRVRTKHTHTHAHSLPVLFTSSHFLLFPPSLTFPIVYWFHRFEPKQFLISTLPAYEADPAGVLKDTAHFLGSEGIVGNTKNPTSMNSVKVAPSSKTKPTQARTPAPMCCQCSWLPLIALDCLCS